MASIIFYLSLIVFNEFLNTAQLERPWVTRQESCKEMVVNYEILFARAQNQLHSAKISSKNGNLGTKSFICSPYFADFLLKTNTPSRISERFFKQISFHAKFTF
jgi:hypothetical protein